MPGGDRSGPLGQGPKTGGGFGNCSGERNERPFSRWGFGRGRGGGRGRGFGRRRADDQDGFGAGRSGGVFSDLLQAVNRLLDRENKSEKRD